MNNSWYSLSIGDIEKKLNTNAASGLSRKAARSRYIKGGRNDLFRIRRASISTCLKRVLSEPITLIMMAVLIIALIFDLKAQAASTFIILCVNLSMSIVAFIKADRIFEATARYSRPLARVVREGKLYYVDSETVVRGDILIFRAGDISPCDVRLITSDKLSVLSPTGSDDNWVKLSKDANATYPAEKFISVENRDNCVCGGSEILRGSARAIAVEVGKHTYLGAKRAGFELRNDTVQTEASRSIGKLCSKYSLFMLVGILPLSIIGLYLGNASSNLFGSIMIALALAVAGMGEQLSSVVYSATAFLISSVSMSGAEENSAIIKNPESVETLSSISDLFIMERAALSDGKPKFAAVYAAGKIYYSDKIRKDYPMDFFESSYLFGRGYFASPSYGISVLNNKLSILNKVICDSEYDNKACEIIYDQSSYSYEEVHGKKIFCHCVNAGSANNSKKILMLEGTELAEKCTHYRGLNGETFLIDVIREDICSATKQFKDSSCDMVTYATLQGNKLILEGIAAFRESFCKNASEYISRLNSRNIEVRCFMTSENSDNISYLLNSGFVDSVRSIAFASEFESRERDITANYGRYKAYLGFSAEQIAVLVSFLNKRDRKVAVLGMQPSETKIADKASIAFTCDSTQYRTSKINEVLLDTMCDDGQIFSTRASQNMRMRSDIVIRRASRTGGGLGGVLKALSCSDSIIGNLCLAVSYLVFSQMQRMIVSVVSMIFGLNLLTSSQLLFGGMIVDLSAIFLVCMLRFEYSSDTRPNKEALRSPIKNSSASIISGIASSVTILAVSLYSYFGGSATPEMLSSFAFASTISSCAVVLLSSIVSERRHSGGSARSRTYSLLLVILSISILAPIVLSVIPAVNSFFGATFMGIRLMLFSLAVPVVAFISYLISSYRESVSFNDKDNIPTDSKK